MANGPYKIPEAVFLVVGTICVVVFWILSALHMEVSSRFIPIICIVFALAFFPRPLWLLANIGRFSGFAEATVVSCRAQSTGRTIMRICTLNYTDGFGRAYEVISDSYAVSRASMGKRYNVRFDPAAPSDFMIVPYAYRQAAIFAVLGAAVETVLIILTINL